MRATLLAIFSCLSAPTLLAAQANRPNVVLIMTDDQGYGDLGVHGNPVLRTPHLDALAAESATVSRFYVCPVCAPTRAGLMTGRYHYRTRVVDTYVGRAMMDPDEVTVAELLRDAGWATGIFGKWHLGDCYPMRPSDQGFEHALVHRGGGIGQPSDPPGGEARYTDAVLFRNGEREDTEGYCTDVYFDRAAAWIEREAGAGRPFFAYIAPNCPHGPFGDVPEAELSRYRASELGNAAFPQERGHPLPDKVNADRRARIFAMVDNIDQNVGRLMAKLRALDLVDDTIVIFMVDNGPNGRRYVAGMRGMKGEVWEGGIRSPFFVRWPARLRAGHVVRTPGAYIDVLPTLLDACEVSPPDGLRLDGRSLLPALSGAGEPDEERAIFIQAHRGDQPVELHHFAAIGTRWKLLRPSGFGREAPADEVPLELYDLAADPLEQRDVAADHPMVVTAIRAAYRRWFRDVTTTRPAGPPRIVAGSAVEDPVVLTRQDWRIPPRGEAWSRHARGRWLLRIDRAGAYRVVARFTAAQDGEWLLVRIGDVERVVEVERGATEAVVEVPGIPAGDAELVAELRTDDAARGVHQADLFAPPR